jgi:hypothetical protein
MAVLLIPFTVVFVILAAVIWQMRVRGQREAHIRTFVLPKGLYDKLRAKHPDLSLKDCQLVAQGLRQFFLTYLKSGHQYVSMPSQVVDDLWHEFILYTKNYQQFCDKAFGRFMHHTPAAVMGSATQSNTGLRRCWWHACREENINPAKPTRLPLLFALDTKLNISNGFRYAADCGVARLRGAGPAAAGAGVIYCGGDFSSTSVDGSTDGFGDSSSSNGGSDSGDGGSGCGGGCGGGGGD